MEFPLIHISALILGLSGYEPIVIAIRVGNGIKMFG